MTGTQAGRHAGTQADVSECALRVLATLVRLIADCAERAVPDHKTAVEADVPQRNVIELAEKLAALNVAVVATCGARDGDRRGKGRFITDDHRRIRRPAARTLHEPVRPRGHVPPTGGAETRAAGD